MSEDELQFYLEQLLKDCPIKYNSLQYEVLKTAFVDETDYFFDERRQSGKSHACYFAASLGALIVGFNNASVRFMRRQYFDLFKKNTSNIIAGNESQIGGLREGSYTHVIFDECFLIKRKFKEMLFSRVVPPVIIEIGSSIDESVPGVVPSERGLKENIFLQEEFEEYRMQKRVESKNW